MDKEETKATTRKQHELGIAELPEYTRTSCWLETREQVLENNRFRIHTWVRAKNDNHEVGQLETNGDLNSGAIRETLVSYER